MYSTGSIAASACSAIQGTDAYDQCHSSVLSALAKLPSAGSSYSLCVNTNAVQVQHQGTRNVLYTVTVTETSPSGTPVISESTRTSECSVQTSVFKPNMTYVFHVQSTGGLDMWAYIDYQDLTSMTTVSQGSIVATIYASGKNQINVVMSMSYNPFPPRI